MASCGSLQQIFENPLPENPTLIQSLSPWNQIKTIKKPIEVSSFTEIFGELQFKENHPHDLLSSSILSSSTASSPLALGSTEKLENNKNPSTISCLGIPNNRYQFKGCSKKSDVYSSKNSERLQLCTEGLGVESFDGVEEESMNEKGDDSCWVNNSHENKVKLKTSPSSNLYQEFKRSRTGGARSSFPPPISCIASSGKPWVSFKSYRQDGRFVLKEIRIPTQEFLHACREDGRLKLHFVHHDQEILDQEEDTETEEEEEDADDDDSNEDQNNAINKDAVQNNSYWLEDCRV